MQMAMNTLSSKRILLVDDQAEILELLQDALKYEGYLVDTCSGAKEALVALSNQDYTHVISDYQMPEINGVEFANKARNDLKDRMPSFYLATGDCSIDIDNCDNLGVDGVLPKPFSLKQVLKIIDTPETHLQ